MPSIQVISPYDRILYFLLKSGDFFRKIIDFRDGTDYTKFVVHGLHCRDEAGREPVKRTAAKVVSHTMCLAKGIS